MRKLAALAAVSLVLAACGSSGPDDADVDVDYVSGMVAHHEQAVEMTDLVADRDASPEVTALAATIAGEQQPEIDRMTGWLDDWDVEDSTDHGSMDHGSGGMAGMMSGDEMTDLENASGPAFDRLWLELMIQHHQGAVDSSEQVIAEGDDPDVRALAESIVTSQTDQIDQMKALLR